MRTKRTYICLVGEGSLGEPNLLTADQIKAVLEFFEVDKELATYELRQIERIEKELAAAGLYDLEKIELKDGIRHYRSANPAGLKILQKGGEKTWQ